MIMTHRLLPRSPLLRVSFALSAIGLLPRFASGQVDVNPNPRIDRSRPVPSKSDIIVRRETPMRKHSMHGR
jgi:hypothetical protein